MSRHRRTRRSGRPCPPRPHHWTPEQWRTFSEWICQRQMDIESQKIRLQTRQNRVALEILDAEAQYTRETNSVGAQYRPSVVYPRGRRLLRQWDDGFGFRAE